jgi:hypothetical protein
MNRAVPVPKRSSAAGVRRQNHVVPACADAQSGNKQAENVTM